MATGSYAPLDNNPISSDICSSSSEFYESSDDSVVDKNFVPSNDDESSDTSEEGDSPVPTKLSRITETTPEKTPQTRWRQRRDENYEQVKRKRRRNLGQEYSTVKSKKLVKPRELGSPCRCQKNCRDKLSNSHENIFSKFWDLGSYDLQNSYLFGAIRVLKKKRSYKKKQKRQESSRQFTAQYIVNVDGRDVRVCKVEFMSVHGLQNCRGRIDHIVKMKTTGAVVPIKDGRVKQSAYRKIFCTEYNIGFKLPKSDTCKICDESKIKLDIVKSNNDDKEEQRLTTSLTLHQNRAKAMRNLLKLETDRSKSTTNVCVISFDLQQAMPIPKLTTGPAFYCRKVWLYNLGVHDCTAEQGHMFLWTENQAKRGADEVASVLFKFLKDKKDVDHLVVFTDNCPGQNKNWQLMAFWLQLVKEKWFKTITHHFLVTGHTHLPSDRDFALIEKRHRKYAPEVYSPEGWHKIIKDANNKNPFKVTVMQQEDFLKFELLLANVQKSTRMSNKENLDFSGVYTFHFKTENTKSFFVKHSVNGEYNEVNITKKGRPVNTPLCQLKNKYMEPIKISKKKLKNVQSLFPYIPPIHLPFFNGLTSRESDEEDVEIV
ncbi:unnamed protein product [Acanthoscelides obtectus]|uniref:DUF7869 domain-containing protein n=2 Tax=Acanthoscelides obtectus TaxID=200917 RepID=A0A9P0PZ67_ACAOB|nr:unnamed protein product [Acanthoscelides obtectus]CAK1627642.1 hypothetical protein AOBTE_LOCUS4727 [Acanthoscelides obtectus]